jgi:hypothetical protein
MSAKTSLFHKLIDALKRLFGGAKPAGKHDACEDDGERCDNGVFAI